MLNMNLCPRGVAVALFLMVEEAVLASVPFVEDGDADE